MTTATQQNTVFLVATPARCETGTQIRKDMLAALKATHTADEWYPVEGKWYKKFVKHVANCPACYEYEQSKGRMIL